MRGCVDTHTHTHKFDLFVAWHREPDWWPFWGLPWVDAQRAQVQVGPGLFPAIHGYPISAAGSLPQTLSDARALLEFLPKSTK